MRHMWLVQGHCEPNILVHHFTHVLAVFTQEINVPWFVRDIEIVHVLASLIIFMEIFNGDIVDPART